MVDTRELAEFLNDKSCKDGDIVVFLGEGAIEKLESDGKVKKVLNIPVEVNGIKLTYTPGAKAKEILQKAYGFDTKAWIGKKFQVKLVVMQVGQKELNVIKPIPLNEKVV